MHAYDFGFDEKSEKTYHRDPETQRSQFTHFMHSTEKKADEELKKSKFEDYNKFKEVDTSIIRPEEFSIVKRLELSEPI